MATANDLGIANCHHMSRWHRATSELHGQFLSRATYQIKRVICKNPRFNQFRLGRKVWTPEHNPGVFLDKKEERSLDLELQEIDKGNRVLFEAVMAKLVECARLPDHVVASDQKLTCSK